MRRGDAVEQRLALLLATLDVVPVRFHGLGVVGLDIAEHVRVAAHELVVHAVDDVDDREAAGLLGDGGVELDVVQEVAELLDDVGVRRRVGGIERFQSVDELERLFDEVWRQRLVRLLAVPRAPLPQRAGELVEADVVVADGVGKVGDVHTRQMIGVDGAVEIGPGRADDVLVGGTEALEDRDRLAAVRPLDSELDVREHPVGMGVGDQQWTVRTTGGTGELVSVDEANADLDRVDSEACPGEVEKRQRRQHVAADARIGAEQLNRTFEDERRPGHGVEDLALLGGVGDEPLDDLGVDVGETVSGFVDVVEAGRRADEVGSRVVSSAEVAVRAPRDGGEGFGGDVSLAARPESDDGDERQLAHS